LAVNRILFMGKEVFTVIELTEGFINRLETYEKETFANGAFLELLRQHGVKGKARQIAVQEQHFAKRKLQLQIVRSVVR
jgi:hypothetical protein